MAFGGPQHITFIVRPKEALTEALGKNLEFYGDLFQSTRRCDVRIWEFGGWTIDDYRAQVQLGVLADLYEIAEDERIVEIFGTPVLSICDVEKWWEIYPVEYDDILDLGSLFNSTMKKPYRLPTTNRPLVDKWVEDSLTKKPL